MTAGGAIEGERTRLGRGAHAPSCPAASQIIRASAFPRVSVMLYMYRHRIAIACQAQYQRWKLSRIVQIVRHDIPALVKSTGRICSESLQK
jgi:hypothetical protein